MGSENEQVEEEEVKQKRDEVRHSESGRWCIILGMTKAVDRRRRTVRVLVPAYPTVTSI